MIACPLLKARWEGPLISTRLQRNVNPEIRTRPARSCVSTRGARACGVCPAAPGRGSLARVPRPGRPFVRHLGNLVVGSSCPLQDLGLLFFFFFFCKLLSVGRPRPSAPGRGAAPPEPPGGRSFPDGAGGPGGGGPWGSWRSPPGCSPGRALGRGRRGGGAGRGAARAGYPPHHQRLGGRRRAQSSATLSSAHP